MNHVITIRNRRIAVDNPTLIKGCRNSDTITLDTDEEWDGKTITVYVGSDDHKVKATYDGEPMSIDIDFPIGYIPVLVKGETGDEAIYTEQATHAFRVKAGKQ